MGKIANFIGTCGGGGIAYDHTENEIFYGVDENYWNKGIGTEKGCQDLYMDF